VVHFETYKAGAFLVWQLRHAGVSIIEDGGDIIHARLPTGEAISIHLIESSIPLYEIRNTLAYNEAKGLHTLFLLWCDMLLPPEDHVVEPHDWEMALLALYGDCIYAYEIFGQEIFVFPVHFEPYNQYRLIRYGETLNMKTLAGVTLDIHLPTLRGRWRVAGFGGQARQTEQPSQDTDRTHHARPAQVVHQLAPYYALLGIEVDAAPEAVKTAYRRLARKFHPDHNQAPDATEKMQTLNEAYQRIMQTFESDEG
jgi:DnaJ-like protein